MNKEEFDQKLIQYVKLEKELIEYLETLESAGQECECDEPEDFMYLDGENNIINLCCNCGGYLEVDIYE